MWKCYCCKKNSLIIKYSLIKLFGLIVVEIGGVDILCIVKYLIFLNLRVIDYNRSII